MDKKDKKRIANKKWYESHKNEIQEKRLLNKDKQKEFCAIYYAKNKEIYKKRAKEWAKNNPDKDKKIHMIARWKRSGIIADDWDNVYKIYIDTTNCDYCKKEFKTSKDRQCDHDHDIIDANNIRGFICVVCNLKDALKGCPPIF